MKINSEVWYTPDTIGRLDIEPFEVTIRKPGGQLYYLYKLKVNEAGKTAPLV